MLAGGGGDGGGGDAAAAAASGEVLAGRLHSLVAARWLNAHLTHIF
jgi:hypothetical protein